MPPARTTTSSSCAGRRADHDAGSAQRRRRRGPRGALPVLLSRRRRSTLRRRGPRAPQDGPRRRAGCRVARSLHHAQPRGRADPRGSAAIRRHAGRSRAPAHGDVVARLGLDRTRRGDGRVRRIALAHPRVAGARSRADLRGLRRARPGDGRAPPPRGLRAGRSRRQAPEPAPRALLRALAGRVLHRRPRRHLRPRQPGLDHRAWPHRRGDRGPSLRGVRAPRRRGQRLGGDGARRRRVRCGLLREPPPHPRRWLEEPALERHRRRRERTRLRQREGPQRRDRGARGVEPYRRGVAQQHAPRRRDRGRHAHERAGREALRLRARRAPRQARGPPRPGGVPGRARGARRGVHDRPRGARACGSAPTSTRRSPRRCAATPTVCARCSSTSWATR